jgi:hypothetical protein
MQKQEPCPVLNKVEAGAKRGDSRSHARPSSCLVHSGVGSRKESIQNRSQTRPRIVKSATDRNQSQTGSKPEQQTVQAETCIAGLRQKPGQAGPCLAWHGFCYRLSWFRFALYGLAAVWAWSRLTASLVCALPVTVASA